LCILNCRDRFIASWYGIDCQQGRDKAVPTVAESSLPRENAVAQRWWSLTSGTQLPLMHGGSCQLVFTGRAGGSAGPGVRDAVLLFTQGEQRVGDIEFHVRSSDWLAHKHSTDPRYNNVMLHVVLLCDDIHPTTRQDGYSIPVCSLYGFPIVFAPENVDKDNEVWPCHTVMRNLSFAEQEKLLHRTGLLRFEQKTHAFIEELHKLGGEGCDESDPYSACLIVALAEGLAYGRDRAFFRAAGQRLLSQRVPVPEPLGRAPAPSPLDAKRLNVLRKLLGREPNIWGSLLSILQAETNGTGLIYYAQKMASVEDVGRNELGPYNAIILQVLRSYFCTAGLSLARADILICNVVLPFAAAIALLEHNTVLGERAQQLYETHPGLSSNTITRMMSTQLLLTEEPCGSCQQQGLHYIYQQTCQAKHRAECIMGRKIL